MNKDFTQQASQLLNVVVVAVLEKKGGLTCRV